MTRPVTRSQGSPKTAPVGDPEALLRPARSDSRKQAASPRPEALSPRSADAGGSQARRVRAAQVPGFDLDRPASLSPDTFFGTDAAGRRESVVTRLTGQMDPEAGPEAFLVDLAAWHRLSSAGLNAQTHPDIQAEIRSHEPDMAARFVEHARRMPGDAQAAAMRELGPLLDTLLQRPAAEENALAQVRQALDDVLDNRLHPDARVVVNGYQHRFIAQMPPSAEQAEAAAELVHSAGLLPADEQVRSVRTSLATVADLPIEALDGDARADNTVHPFHEIAHALQSVHDLVYATLAMDVLNASRHRHEDIRLQQEVCRAIGEAAVRTTAHHPIPRFARMPEADRPELFLALLDASLDHDSRPAAGAGAWGPVLLELLPANIQPEATQLLQMAMSGQRPRQGFREAGQDWSR